MAYDDLPVKVLAQTRHFDVFPERRVRVNRDDIPVHNMIALVELSDDRGDQKAIVKMPEFQALLKQYDTQGKFRNQFLDTNIFGS
jgi:hypothetical protein